MSAHTGGSIADAIEYQTWTDEQRRVARAGVEFEQLISDAREEAFDAGRASGLAEARTADVERVVNQYEDVLADVWARLRLFLPQFSEADTRAATVREITAIVAAGVTRG